MAVHASTGVNAGLRFENHRFAGSTGPVQVPIESGGPGAQTVVTAAPVAGSQFFTATVTPGAVTVTTAAPVAGSAFFTATVTATVTVTTAAPVSGSQFFNPTVLATAEIATAAPAAATQFYNATVTQGGAGQTVTTAAPAASAVIYQPSVTPGAVTITTSAPAAGTQFYNLTATYTPPVAVPYQTAWRDQWVEWSGYQYQFMLNKNGWTPPWSDTGDSAQQFGAFYYDALMHNLTMPYIVGDTSTIATRLPVLDRAYRDGYVDFQNGNVTGFNLFTGGLRRDWELNGDEASRQAVYDLSRNAAFANGDPADTADALGFTTDGGARENACRVMAELDARACGYAARSNLNDYLDQCIDHLDQLTVSPTADYCKVFFVALVSKALIQAFQEYPGYPGRSSIQGAIASAYDYIWDNAWVPYSAADPNSRSFLYAVPDGQEGNSGGQPDLNGLILPPLGWLYQQTGQSKWRERGDEVFLGMIAEYDEYGFWVRGPNFGNVPSATTQEAGKKQFNQTYQWSAKYTIWGELTNEVFTSPPVSASQFFNAEVTQGAAGSQTITTAAPAAASQFYQATVTPGSVTVTTAAPATGAQFYQPTVAAAAAIVTAAPVAGAQFFSATVSSSSTVSTAAPSPTTTLYQPTVTPGAVTVTTDPPAAASQFYQASVTASATIATAVPSVGTNFYNSTITPGSVSVATAAPVPSAVLYEPEVTQGAAGSQTVTTAAPSSSAAVYEPTVSTGAVAVVTAAPTPTATVYQPGVAASAVVAPEFLTPGTVFYDAAVQPGTVVVVADALASGSQVFAPAASSSATVSAALVVSSAVVHQPTVTPGEVVVSAALIRSGAVVPEPEVVGGIVYPGISFGWSVDARPPQWSPGSHSLHYAPRAREPMDYTAPGSRLSYGGGKRLHWTPRADG